jgi:predicted short-subunit dehydrogenase-like oxidoreductase (DUF2520 family)
LKKINTISIIGSGNVGTQLGIKLFDSGYKIDAIYGYREKSGKQLAERTSSKYIDLKNLIQTESDLYIVSLKDDIYEKILHNLNLENKFIVHTSGSFESQQLSNISERWGCLYPLQSINKKQEVNWDSFNFYIEAANSEDENILMKLCNNLGFEFEKADSKQRKKIHIAAVATNNFTYHFISTIRTFCKENDIDFDNLKDLLNQSIKNSFKGEPFKLQTGPAIRKDTELVDDHINTLENNKNLKEIYELFTKQILNQHHEL